MALQYNIIPVKSSDKECFISLLSVLFSPFFLGSGCLCEAAPTRWYCQASPSCRFSSASPACQAPPSAPGHRSPSPSQRRGCDGQRQLDRCGRHVLPTALAPAPAVEESGGQSAHHLLFLSLKIKPRSPSGAQHCGDTYGERSTTALSPDRGRRAFSPPQLSCWEPDHRTGCRGDSAPLKSRHSRLGASHLLSGKWLLSFFFEVKLINVYVRC